MKSKKFNPQSFLGIRELSTDESLLIKGGLGKDKKKDKTKKKDKDLEIEGDIRLDIP